jgi:membrane protein
LLERLKNITLPGLGGVPLWDVIKFFIRHASDEVLTIRSAAIAYNFFLALFPALIFVFTLIPYFQIQNLQVETMNFLKEFLPESAFQTIQTTLVDILSTRRGNLLSIGFIMAIWFTSNGMNALLQTFNPAFKRAFWKRRLEAIFLTILLAVMMIVAFTLLLGGKYILLFIDKKVLNEASWILYLILGFRYVIIFGLTLTAVSFTYYVGSPKNERFYLYTPGALLATISMGITSYGFGFYVDHFGNYNKFYGSLGTIIVLMIWLYFNAIMIIGGFDFNQTINKLKRQRDKG